MKGMKTQGSVWKRLSTMILISFGIWAGAGPSRAHPLLHPVQNRTGSHAGLILEPSAGIFSTSENFDSTSNRVPLTGSNSNMRFLMDLTASYGLSDHLFLFGRLSLQNVNISIMGQPGVSSFGLGDQLVGAAYRLISFDSGASINLQTEATIPAYSNTTAKVQGQPYMGDGSTDLTGSSFVEIPLGSGNDWYIEGGAGFTYRSNGFSTAIPYSLFLKQDPSQRGLIFEIGMAAQASLKTDIATNDSGQRARLDQDRMSGSAGSFLLNAMNPSWMTAVGRIGFKNSIGHRYTAGVLFPFSGTNSAAGIGGTLAATFDLGASAAAKKDPRSESATGPRGFGIPKGFQTYDLDAQITSFNDQLYLVKIDQGASNGIRKGQIFDIFDKDTIIAQARVSQVKDDECVLSVIEYYHERWIEKGFTARRRVQ
jgi:hypothetical protein